MCSSFKATCCRSRSALIASITLASGTLAGVIPTARIRPLSRTRAPMPLVSIHPHAPTFATMAHLSVFDADAPVLGNPLDEARLSLFADLHILLLDLFCNRQDRIGHSFVLWIAQLLDPGINCVQHLQNQCQRLVFLELLIPVPIQRCLQACATDQFCPRAPSRLRPALAPAG